TERASEEERIDDFVSMERLFNELPYDNRMSVEEYLSCDNNIPAEELITDEEIIEVVLEEDGAQVEGNTNEEVEIRPTISLHQAVTGLKTLTQFLQYSTELEILPEDIVALYRVQRLMELKYTESLKQKTLDSYVNMG
ncbi:1158_t:CDS:2, partial [Ambispora leptoticha]